MLPYLTRDLAGIGGVLRKSPEDFFVQEIPLYDPLGQGEHVFCEIQKVGMTTFDAIDELARILNVSPRDVGYAGIKDARAVARQIFSIPRIDPEAALKIQQPNLAVRWAIPHNNKLRLGHLAGNRFAIRLRDVQPTDVVKVQPIVKLLEQRGMPNYFGEQRFGRRQNNHLLGAALLSGNDAEVLRLLLGDPQSEIDDANTIGARKAFDRGEFESAMKLFPRRHGMERRVLARFIKTKNATTAVRAVDERIRRLWTSALQSELFNAVVAERIDSLNQVFAGDLAWKHENGAVFKVEDAEKEQPRADTFEISPSGPLLGYRMTLPEGVPLEIEQKVFAERQLNPASFRVEGKHKIKGARRPLRVQPKDIDLTGGVDEKGAFVTNAFTLPPGSFATVFMREVMKNDSDP